MGRTYSVHDVEQAGLAEIQEERKERGKNMKVGVVGNRLGWDYDFFCEVLETLGVNGSDIIISGGAEGVDSFAQGYARENGCEMIILYPKPGLLSPERYFKRNQEIALRCDVLIAFDKGSSSGSGTLNTINHAKKAKKKVIIIDRETTLDDIKTMMGDFIENTE